MCVHVTAYLRDAEDAGLQEPMMLHRTDSQNSPDGQNIFSQKPEDKNPTDNINTTAVVPVCPVTMQSTDALNRE